MKTTIKFAALGALALAASSTAALAGPNETPQGITTGLALGAPLPEGVYDISIASYGGTAGAGNVAYAAPVWLIWSTPWQIAGGRIGFSTTTAVADAWKASPGLDSWVNTFVDASIKWNLGNGWNVGLAPGVYLPSTQALPVVLGRDYTAFQGLGSISYLANGWNLTATGIYVSGGEPSHLGASNSQSAFFNLDLTATKKLGKMEIGAIAYGTWQLDNQLNGNVSCPVSAYRTGCKASEFAMGGLVGYDFGSFVAQAKMAGDVTSENIGGNEVRGWLTIIKPLWNPEAGSLK